MDGDTAEEWQISDRLRALAQTLLLAFMTLQLLSKDTNQAKKILQWCSEPCFHFRHNLLSAQRRR